MPEVCFNTKYAVHYYSKGKIFDVGVELTACSDRTGDSRRKSTGEPSGNPKQPVLRITKN